MELDGSEETGGEDDSSARGILQCLRMLAEEAATLGLPLTLHALNNAIAACQAENAESRKQRGFAPAMPPPGAVVH